MSRITIGVYDWLDELADEVVLAHPSKFRAIAEARIKTDKIDSETLIASRASAGSASARSMQVIDEN